MRKDEAKALLQARVEELRALSFEDLRRFFDEQVDEVHGPSGQKYQLETRAVWDGEKHGNIRIMVCIDDGGWRAFFPRSSGFIKAPDNSFIDE